MGDIDLYPTLAIMTVSQPAITVQPSVRAAWLTVLARIARAQQPMDTPPKPVRLLAVSKAWSAEQVMQLYALGQREFGENYVQEAIEKMALLDSLQQGVDIVWHCIGPVQTNKSRLVASHFDWLHTLDRVKLAERLNQQRPGHLPPLNVCIQVNVDDSHSKAGVHESELNALVQAVLLLPRLALKGLMVMPDPASEDGTRHHFQKAAHLFVGLQDRYPQLALDTLSMGMSGDLEWAIAEGSTLVRVGGALMGPRVRKHA